MWPTWSLVVSHNPVPQSLLCRMSTTFCSFVSIYCGALMISERFSRRSKERVPPQLNVTVDITVFRPQTTPTSLQSNRATLALGYTLSQIVKGLLKILANYQLK